MLAVLVYCVVCHALADMCVAIPLDDLDSVLPCAADHKASCYGCMMALDFV